VDGEYLIDLCRRGKVVVWLRAESSEEWRRSQKATAWVEGSEEPEKFVVIGGHMDSWGGGVTCNATRNFAVLEVVRAMALHPINFSVTNRYGFDHYGLTALSTPIPCLYETRNLASLSPRSTEYQALITPLVQQANRVSDGLREASELIETAMEDWRRI
jgi:hypothetical protein